MLQKRLTDWQMATKQLMKRSRITQREVAAEIPATERSVNDWLNQDEPEQTTRQAVADAVDRIKAKKGLTRELSGDSVPASESQTQEDESLRAIIANQARALAEQAEANRRREENVAEMLRMMRREPASPTGKEAGPAG